MKPLLKPARQPHPDMLTNMLGISGRASARNLSEFESAVARILAEFQVLTSVERPRLEQKLDERDTSLRTYCLECKHEGEVGSAGIVSLAYNRHWYTLTGKLSWPFLPVAVDRVVDSMDRLWKAEQFLVLYVYDQDDYSLQNATAVPGMEHWGLDRDQVDFVNRFGIVEEIDTRANPGYMLNHEGLLWSVQWLDY